MNNFMTAQAPMSSMVTSNGAGGQGGDGNMGGGGPTDNSGGIQGELDQLQQVYDRQGGGGDRGSQHHPIAEFLYQLTKMLTDDNSEIIEWVDGRIKVHYPERLEGEVLHKYFRHSKFASFQRQLNYFGFRKIAGKGKMSPCSYVNEAATSDIRSLLLIKRKTNGSAARKAAMAQRSMQMPPGMGQGMGQDLRANLSALAAGAAAATGNPQVNRLNSQGFNPAALFQGGQGGLGQFGMQQKSLGSNLFLNNENAMSLFMSGQKQPSAEDLLQQNGMQKTQSTPSIEQLHAQLAASLANRQGQNGGLNSQQMNHQMGLASQAMNQMNSQAGQGNNGGNNNGSAGPASAAMNATAALNNLQQQNNQGGGGPATAAMSQASAVANNLFDSAANLKSLVGDQQQGAGPAGAPGGQGGFASQQFLQGRFPSSGGLFPDGNLSTASFGNLLASNNRLSSLLSLNSFLSRDPSTADLLGGGVFSGNAQQQLAASQAANAAAGLQNNNMQRYQ